MTELQINELLKAINQWGQECHGFTFTEAELAEIGDLMRKAIERRKSEGQDTKGGV